MASTGRWKANTDGSAVWDSEDSGPDQTQPTDEQRAQQQGQTQTIKPQADIWGGDQTKRWGGTDRYGMPRVIDTPGYDGAIDGGFTGPWGSGGGGAGNFTPIGGGLWDPSKVMPWMQGNNQQNQTQPQNQVGHDGVYNGMNREQWRDAWMGSGQMTQDQMKQKLTEMGATPSGRGDVWTTPHGETYDLGIGFKTGNPTAGWTPVSGAGPAGGGFGGAFGTPGFGAAAGSYGGGAGGTLPGGGGGGTGFNLGGDRSSYLWNILAGRAGMNEVPSAKDPIIASQVNSFRAEQERAARNNLDQAAESQGPNSNLNLERRMGNEAVARATGGLQAQVMANELTQRRGMIQNALSQMGGMLSDDQKLALQRELGLIEASLSQQRINSGNDQFMAELGLRAEDQANRWDWTRSGGTF